MLLFPLSSLLLAATHYHAFTPAVLRSTTTSNTRLFISSWTSDRPREQSKQARDPDQYIQDYLPAPEAVEARSTIDGALVVTGLVGERNDQFLLDLLNHQESAFEFETIRLLVPDAGKAKKQLLSRSARYTGLLDKLECVSSSSSSDSDTDLVLPTAEQLEGVSTWLAVVDHKVTDGPTACATIAALAKATDGLSNVAILVTNAVQLETAACQTAVDALNDSSSSSDDDGLSYTVVAVGPTHDGPEGGECYQYEPLTEAPALSDTAVFGREEAYRIISELLQLECGVNKALAFAEVYNVNATETKLIKGLREAGYDRMQEIDHMLREGPEVRTVHHTMWTGQHSLRTYICFLSASMHPQGYEKAIDEWRNRNPDWDKGYTTDIWWEAPEYKESRARSEARAARLAELDKEELQSEVEVLAKDWARREYFKQTMSGAVDSATVSEEEYVETVWDRALKEGEWAYKKSKGELTEEEAAGELVTFKARQAKKEEVMLQRAKEELAKVMKEDLTEEKKDDDEEDDDDDEE